MNLRQLEYFVAIADAGSFTRAAEALTVAQPSLSQQIKALEQELGGRLLERLPKGVRLTSAGREFLVEARTAVTHAERAARAARSALGLRAGELEVATVTSVGYGVLPPALQRWHADYPDVGLTLREFRHRRTMEEAVSSGSGDIAVGPRPRDWPGEIVELGWEEFVVVLPHGDPLAAGGERIPIAALRDRDWVMFAPDHGLSDVIRFVCARAGFTPRGAVVTAQVASAAHLAAAGLGVALIPDNVVPAGLTAEIRRLRAPVVRPLVAFAREGFGPAARAFIDVLRQQQWSPRPRGAIALD